MIPDDLLESVATMRKPRASGDDPFRLPLTPAQPK